MEFDGLLAKAESLLHAQPLQTHLSEREIEQMATYQFASILQEDKEVRRDGTGSEVLFQSITAQLHDAGFAHQQQVPAEGKPAFGLSDREMLRLREGVEDPLACEKALARGDISFVREELTELLDAFRVNLDRGSKA
jgi:hypothetical protein